MTTNLTYLCIPYTFNPELSFAIANEIASELMLKGEVVFSPISHSHHIADYIPKQQRFSPEFWLKQDLLILNRCDQLLVVKIGEKGQKLIDKSVGCQSEIKQAVENNIPINYYQYDFQNE